MERFWRMLLLLGLNPCTCAIDRALDRHVAKVENFIFTFDFRMNEKREILFYLYVLQAMLKMMKST